MCGYICKGVLPADKMPGKAVIFEFHKSPIRFGLRPWPCKCVFDETLGFNRLEFCQSRQSVQQLPQIVLLD